MKSIKIVAASIAALTLAGCANDEYIGNGESPQQSKNTEISFAMKTPNMTRATDLTGGDAAAKLNNNFIVYGFKTTGDTEAADGSNETKVFDLYNVNYKANTANSTLSNTADWEYVGYNSAATTPVEQTIKYWDLSAKSYVFSAIAGQNITGITKTTTGNTVYDKGWKVSIPAAGSIDGFYASDRKVVASTEYKKQVDLKFRSLGTKIRFGIYETIPGYSVKIDKVFYVSDDAAPTAKNSTSNFAIKGNFRYTNKEQTTPLTITYFNAASGIENRPKVTFNESDVTVKKSGVFGTNILSVASIGTTSTEATYDKADKGYTVILPYEEAKNNLKLKITYTLTSTDNSGEKITVHGATAFVPAQYTQWKPNYAYTYIFKISDKTNGTTVTPSDPDNPGPDPDDPGYDPEDPNEGLYPITFDAVVIADGDGIQETITTVSEPSITTYSKGVQPTANNEYKKNNNIYVSVNAPQVELSATNSKLYTVALDAPTAAVYSQVTGSLTAGKTYYTSNTGDGAFTATGSENTSENTYYELTTPAVNPLQSITEASVANAIAKGTYNEAAKTYTVTDANGKKLVVTESATALSFETAISAEDSPTGAAITGKYAMFKPTSTGYYVYEYSRPVSYDEGTQLTDGASLNGYYTKRGDTYTACGENDTADGTSAYYKIKVPAGKFYKIINVVD